MQDATTTTTTRGVSHCGQLAIFSLKLEILRPKEELWKFKYFSMQKYNLQKKSFKRNQKSSKIFIITLIITNLKFQHKKPNSHLSKILI
jgi:hypothetical protein